MFRKPRALDAVECRVLGALLEKEQATPEYYPMTVSALVAAANQKTNRDPVMELGEDDVQAALDRLFKDVLVWRAPGARATKWSHNLDRRWGLEAATKAAITLLLLRGDQTAGEIRGRSDRLHAFDSIADAEAALRSLAQGDEPLVEELPRAPGQKENRWRHLVGVEADHSAPPVEPVTAPAGTRAPSVSALLIDRIDELERRIARLESELASVRLGVPAGNRREPDES
jgi:uncharacterized protein YceH (UPF0502 family)